MSREENMLKKERRPLNARAARLKAEDREHATYGYELQDLGGEVKRLRKEVDGHHREAREM